MKKPVGGIVFLGILLAAGTASHAQNQQSQVGIGVMIGEPTGITFKKWTSGTTAIDLGMAWSIGRYDALHVHADYLWHNRGTFAEVDEGSLMPYVGVGGRLLFLEEDVRVGLRIPLGINYLFDEAPLELFLEVAPVVSLVPDTDFDMTGNVGVRVYI